MFNDQLKTYLTNLRLKRLAITLLGLGLVLYIILWISSHGFISVQITNDQSSGSLTYSLMGQSTSKASPILSTSHNLKRLVKQDYYEVLVRQANYSYFSLVKTSGFLANTAVSGSLTPEKQRSFIGDNPGSCMFYNGQELISYVCSGPFYQAQAHIPATATQPTYTQNNGSAGQVAGDAIEGIIKTTEGSLILLHTSLANPITGGLHVIYPLRNDLSLGSGTILKDLDSTKTYNLQAYGPGFIVYDSSFAQLLYFASMTTMPVTLKIDRPTDTHFSAQSLTVAGDSIVLSYSYVISSSSTKPNFRQTAVVTYSSTGSKRYTLNDAFSSAYLCGQLLCLQQATALVVFQPSSQQLKKLYAINGVISSFSSAHGILIVQANGVLNFNPDTRSGWLEYSFNKYGNCGSQPAEAGFVLCLVNPKGNKVALYVNQAAVDNDSIDQKIATLESSKLVSNVTLYGSHIFVSTNVQPSYDPSSGSYSVNSSAQQQATSAINNEIKSLGINSGTYSISVLPSV